MKSLTYKLILLFIVLLSSTNVSAYDFEVDGIYYNVLSFSDLKCEVTYGDNNYTGEIVIPSKVNINSKFLDVVKIGDYSFRSDTELLSVYIPDSISEIGKYAFEGCAMIKCINLPLSVKRIGESAFQNCTSLENIIIPESVYYIGNAAFKNCVSISNVSLPNSVSVLGAGAFMSCRSLNSVELSESLNVIEGSSFMNCVNIKNINLPSSITAINYRAFANCENLENIKLPESLTLIGDEAFLNCKSFIEIIIPDNVTRVGTKAFADCNVLNSITLSKSMNRISAGLFQGCSSLNDIRIPSTISEGVYYRCTTYYGSGEENLGYSCYPPNLKKIWFEDGKGLFSMIDAEDENKDVTSGKYTESELRMSNWFCRSSDASWHNLSLLPIEEIYVGRPFSEYGNIDKNEQIMIPTIKSITLGKNIVKCQINIKESSELKTLTCLSKTPPTNISFTTQQKMNLIVRVPMDALSLYKETPEWKDLWNLEGVESASSNIIDTVSDNVNIEIGRFNLYGIPVNLEYKGVVIIYYSNGNVVKLFQR